MAIIACIIALIIFFGIFKFIFWLLGSILKLTGWLFGGIFTIALAIGGIILLALLGGAAIIVLIPLAIYFLCEIL